MQLGRRSRHALVGSAAKLTGKDTDYQKRLQEPWQNRALGYYDRVGEIDRKSTRLNSSHIQKSRMPSSA